MSIETRSAGTQLWPAEDVLAAVAVWSSGTADMVSSTAAPTIPGATTFSTNRIRRPFIYCSPFESIAAILMKRRWRHKISHLRLVCLAFDYSLEEIIEHPEGVVEIVSSIVYIIIETAVLQLDKFVILESQVLVFDNLANLCTEIVTKC